VSILKPWLKQTIVMSYDIVSIIFCYLVAHMLRFNTLTPQIFSENIFAATLLLTTIVQFSSLYFAGAYKAIFRFSSTPDLIRISKGILISIPFCVLFIFFLNRLEDFPRSVFIIDALLLLITTGAGRFAYRVFQDQRRNRINMNLENVDKVIIIGAGLGGNKLLRDIKSSPELRVRVVGFVDDDFWKKGKLLHGVKVLGNIEQLGDIIQQTGATKAFLAIPSATSETVRRVIDACTLSPIDLKILPQLRELIDRVDYSQLRSIEPKDLLGRQPVELNHSQMASLLELKRVLITGAGGSIGSELCKQVAKFNPKVIIAFEQTELFLYELERKLKTEFPNTTIISVIGDVRNKEKVSSVFEAYHPEVVFHAAAYKHVPMMEINPMESIFTNVQGTKNVAEAAIEYKTQKFVLISTDKAINPTNVMGTTKRIAEIICEDLQRTSNVKYITIRFGNVLGSSGSVIPLFREQIEKGGPVTVTHPEVKRYFMSIPEACQLVIQAGSIGSGGDIFVLDMGKPVLISNLAREMITLAGFIPDQDIKIEYTGLRDGEKLFEELFSDKEPLIDTPHPKIKVANFSNIPLDFTQKLNTLLGLDLNTDPKVVRETLKEIVPEFKPSLPSVNSSLN
jgi:FlaA1/EpsC-like NDP-sugar epimerase